nr:uncharacterized protein LOC121113788 [Lepeophtheirus salmonis]
MKHVSKLASSKQPFLCIVLIIIKATCPYCSLTCIIILLKKTCKFIEKYTGKTSPGRWVVNNLVGEVCQGVLNRIKEDVEEIVALDETRDHQGRSMAAILIGPLDGHFCD